MTRWFDAQGGHYENKGLSADGEVVDVPRHRHHVTLNTYRIDLGLRYRLGTHWRLEANVPYERKVQEATLEAVEPHSHADWEAIIRNRDTHHRSETYTGTTDSDLFLGYQIAAVFTDNDFLMGRIGTTIPLGKTEEDPWELGDAGLEHLHIQFGTGTFNPTANLQYSLPLYRGLILTASTRAMVPFYENSKTYRGATEVSYTAGFTYSLFKSLLVKGNYLGFYQSAAAWNGERDINTGLRYTMAAFGLSWRGINDVSLAMNVMFPLTQGTLYDTGDTIEFGNLISLTTSYLF